MKTTLPKTYLCTVGTSCARSFGLDRLTDDWARAVGIETATNQLRETLPKELTPGLMQEISGELAPLVKQDLCDADRVILYVSDTPTGCVTGRALERILRDYLPGLDIKVKTIEGLQVGDEQTFRRKGVVNFVKELGDDIDRYGPENCILNPLGGYKALVPYSVLVAMVRGIDSCYLFEGSNALLSLPRLPLDFPTSLLEAVNLLCERIDRESAISSAEYEKVLAEIPAGPQHLEIMFEKDGDDYTLSAVGMLLWQDLNRQRPLVPYISHRTVTEFWRLAQREDCKPLDFINRVCRSRDQLEQKKHGNVDARLSWLKPGRTADRYLVSVEEGWRLLIWRAVAHGEYESLSRIQDLGSSYRGDSSFRPFIRLDFFAPS